MTTYTQCANDDCPNAAGPSGVCDECKTPTPTPATPRRGKTPTPSHGRR